jgi:hypothetical protein
MHAPDEPWDADDPLQVDLDDVERRSVVPVRLGELGGQLVGEGGLPRVTRSEQRHVGLALERESDLISERLHPDDLRRVIERAVPDERVYRGGHGS